MSGGIFIDEPLSPAALTVEALRFHAEWRTNYAKVFEKDAASWRAVAAGETDPARAAIATFRAMQSERDARRQLHAAEDATFLADHLGSRA